MVVFRYKCTDKILKAFSAEIVGDHVAVRFTENGEVFNYKIENVEFIDANNNVDKKPKLPFLVYKFDRECYKCHKNTEIFTYIIFKDRTKNDVTYPWDKKRLLRQQNIMAHMMDESIEYYGLSVIEEDPEYDEKMMEMFPDKIQVKHSNTMNECYPMNVCSHCGSKQGWNFIYKMVNEKIRKNEKIELVNLS